MPINVVKHNYIIKSFANIVKNIYNECVKCFKYFSFELLKAYLKNKLQ